MFIDINNKKINITKIAIVGKHEDKFIRYTMLNGEVILEKFENEELRDAEFTKKKEEISAK